MNSLYKITLLGTMAVVTWKVWEIEKYQHSQKIKVSKDNFNFTRRLDNSQYTP